MPHPVDSKAQDTFYAIPFRYVIPACAQLLHQIQERLFFTW